jgi:hypothetical protein
VRRAEVSVLTSKIKTTSWTPVRSATGARSLAAPLEKNATRTSLGLVTDDFGAKGALSLRQAPIAG